MRIRETEKHFIKLYVSVSSNVTCLILFEKVGKEFLGVSTEDADVLVPLEITVLGTLGTESGDLLMYEFGNLDANLHSQDQVFWE